MVPPTSGTTTAVLAEVETEDETLPEKAEEKTKKRLVLKLRPRRRITFTEDTIDNEHMNKKSSKRCCIYHKARAFGESSSDSSSGESDCDSCPDEDQAPAEGKDAISLEPGGGWVQKKGRRKKIPDYQRFHA